ncbi:outer membrane protein [Marinospirillum celere]|uniref:Outer membrane protein n=1 Tax=Marinospirillum celere TaxID=1122252 RepID=A0A1I1E7A8_9GAMM|nr:TIGR04219 family outer membrane beta-barrel protein [Marinospirillum celere]SFB81188.1 outer membrane protein [Marinospirillum celere]
MRKLLAATGLALTPLMASQAYALSLNVTATADYWNASPSGEIQGVSGDDPVDVKDELGLSSEGVGNLSIQFDHFIPVVPNLRITQTNMEFSGSRDESFTFRDQEFTGNTSSEIDLSHTDFTAYYRFLDGLTSLVPLVSLRLEAGLTVRVFDGGFEVTGEVDDGAGSTESETESVSLSAPVPMGYVGGIVSLPMGVSAGARMNYIGYSGNSLSDVDAFVNYEYRGLPLVTPGVTAGYRTFSLELDDLDDTYGDLTFKGPHFGAYIRAGF